uniref:Uncharacterized protein n=1 Tax=Angiostrongylus cantonensis TaxID=6313 RepID=A0A0K0CWR4_ANGCA
MPSRLIDDAFSCRPFSDLSSNTGSSCTSVILSIADSKNQFTGLCAVVDDVDVDHTNGDEHTNGITTSILQW